jgi:uracil phosphoribosyltransferase
MATTNGTSSSEAVAAITTDVASFGPNVHISKHPVLSHKISVLRSSSTSPGEFRRALREITFHLGYEATSTLTTKPVALNVPLGQDHIDSTGTKIAERIAIIPILRSGLGMCESMLELLPNAGVHHIGMYRQGLVPVQYYNRLPKKCESDVAYVLDPVMATGNTIMSVVKMLKKVRSQEIFFFNCHVAIGIAFPNLLHLANSSRLSPKPPHCAANLFLLQFLSSERSGASPKFTF